MTPILLPTTLCPCGASTYHGPCVEADAELSAARLELHTATVEFTHALERAQKIYWAQRDADDAADNALPSYKFLDTTRP